MAERHGAPAYLWGSQAIETRLAIAYALIALIALALGLWVAILVLRRRRERYLRRHGYRSDTRPIWPLRRK